MKVMRNVRPAWIAAAIAGLAGLAAGYTVAGAAGLALVGTGLTLVILLGIQHQHSRPAGQAGRHPAPGGTVGHPAPTATPRAAGRRRRRRGAPAVSAADFPSFRRIEANLGWATVSRRHYDHVVRPLLTRLLSAALADRHRVDPARQPEQARRLVGAELWPLLDPARPASDDGNAPGVDLATLARIVSRLEDI